MAMAEQIPEAKPQVEPTFLKDVARMATLAEEAIQKLRTEVHGSDDFTFQKLNLSHLFPQTVDSIDYLGRLEGVVNDYLNQTARFGLSERASFRAGTPIEENTSGYIGTVAEWMKAVYTNRKDEIDKRVEEAFLRISNHATQELRNLTFDICSGSQDSDRALAIAGKPALSLEELTGKMSELKTKFYETELPRPEDLAKLYETCFNAEVKQRGWLDLEDDKLAGTLAQENVPMEMFMKYTGREAPPSKEKAAEAVKPKGKLRRILDILGAPAKAAGANGRTPAVQSSSFTARDYIEAPSYFQALQALRTSYINGECPNQPIITHNGQTYARPPTFYELLSAKVNDFHSKSNVDGSAKEGEDPLRFFKVFLDTCTGRHYKGGTTKFKLIPICPQLITLSSEPRANYLGLPYVDSVGDERDSSNGKYGVNLSKSEVLDHQDWLYLANENRQLLGEVFDIVKLACDGDANWKGMAFYINQAPQNDELRSLFVLNHYYQGNANDWNVLHLNGRFLRR